MYDVHPLMKMIVSLSCCRSMQSIGQRLGASGVVTHIQRMASNQMNQYSLSLANVGDVEAVLCRRGDAHVLTAKFTTTASRDECRRVYKSDGIITEDGKVTRLGIDQALQTSADLRISAFFEIF